MRYSMDLGGTQHCFVATPRHSAIPYSPLASQNTLTKTSVQHFPTTYETVTNTFMLGTNHRTNLPSSSRPHTSIDSRYTTICKWVNARTVLQLGLQSKTWFIGMYLKIVSTMCLNNFHICYFVCTLLFYIHKLVGLRVNRLWSRTIKVVKGYNAMCVFFIIQCYIDAI